MAHPTQKATKSRKNIRRGALKLKKMNLTTCPKCKKTVAQHTACEFCGTYKGKEIVKTKNNSKKTVKKDKK
jgi:large subunit ribosomal protein L32